MTDNIRNAYLSLKPTAVGVGSALTAPADPGLYLLDTASGSVLTLPAATGSGKVITATVTTTCSSNAHKILASPTTDILVGVAAGSTVTSKAGVIFSAAAASGFHSLQMPFAGTQPSGGFEGDTFTLTDIAAGKWLVEGTYQSGTTPTTPFSTATT